MRIVLWLLTPVLASAVAFAAEAGGGPPNPAGFKAAPFVTALVLFGTVLFILNKFAWPVLLKALQQREEKIRSEIQQAEGARKQAESALRQYEKALAEARQEAATLLDDARRQQQKLAADMRAKAEREIAQMRDGVKREIDQAKQAAIHEIYDRMVHLSTGIAGKILERELNADDQRRLVEASLGELQAAHAN